jgi:hypothetical protein
VITAIFTSIGLVTGYLYLTETVAPNKQVTSSDGMTFDVDSVEMGSFEGDEFAWRNYGSKCTINSALSIDTPLTIVSDPRLNRLWHKFKASAFVAICTDLAPASAIGMYGLLAIISIVFDEAYSLFCLTSVELGGIGFDEKRIGNSTLVILSIPTCLTVPLQAFHSSFRALLR